MLARSVYAALVLLFHDGPDAIRAKRAAAPACVPWATGRQRLANVPVAWHSHVFSWPLPIRSGRQELKMFCDCGYYELHCEAVGRARARHSSAPRRICWPGRCFVFDCLRVGGEQSRLYCRQRRAVLGSIPGSASYVSYVCVLVCGLACGDTCGCE